MNLLLDTHILLSAAFDKRRNGAAARSLIANPANTLWFSVASPWEVAIKRGLDQPSFQLEAGPLPALPPLPGWIVSAPTESLEAAAYRSGAALAHLSLVDAINGVRLALWPGRLLDLGVVRELTGRDTFRLYGV